MCYIMYEVFYWKLWKYKGARGRQVGTPPSCGIKHGKLSGRVLVYSSFDPCDVRFVAKAPHWERQVDWKGGTGNCRSQKTTYTLFESTWIIDMVKAEQKHNDVVSVVETSFFDVIFPNTTALKSATLVQKLKKGLI